MLVTACLCIPLWLAPPPQEPAPTPQPQQPQPQQPLPRPATERPAVAWQRTLADALAVQEATGLPLLIAVNMDGEVFNERFAGTVYRDREFVESTRGYVCVVASPDRHNDRDYDALGNRIECPRFGGCTCSEHINIEPLLFERYFGGRRNAPRHVGVSKDGKILFDRFLDQSMQTAIDAIEKHRSRIKPKVLEPTYNATELFTRRDALARTLLERRYRDGDREARKTLLEAAARSKNEPFDLLRMALRDDDAGLCGLAALALSKVGSPDALIDIEDALARVDDADIRQALLEQLAKLGEKNADAARLASHFESVDQELPAPWRNEWTADFATTDRNKIERALDYAEARIAQVPDDAAARLRLGTAQAAYAVLLIAEGGDGVAFWLADAARNAGKVDAEALVPEARALTAITSWYESDGTAAHRAAIEALAVGKSERQPSAWLATNFLDVLLQITAQTAFARAGQDSEASLRGELSRVQAVFQLLAKRQGGGERGLLAGIALYEFAGRRAEARTLLLALAERFPASVAVHDRLRQRLVADLGAELMRHTYANWANRATDQATAQWFAAYAALVAGDQHTLDGRTIEAENAYGDAIERFALAAGNDAYTDSSNHYAVLALGGRAVIRHQRGNEIGAVADLVKAGELRPESLDEDDGLRRKPRSIADRVARDLRAAGKNELADRLQPILP
jgi:hypothetical protein